MDSEDERQISVLLDVVPVSCSMRMTRTRDPDQQLRDSLSMRIRLARDVQVRTVEGRSLSDAEWVISFYEGGSDNAITKEHNALGLINYHEAFTSEHYDIDDSPESCYAWVNLDLKTFSLLREMAYAGRLPAGIRLTVHGIRYGWAPDGSEKVWDVAAKSYAIIKAIEIGTSYVEPPELPSSEDDDGGAWEEPKPVSPELVAARATTRLIEQLNARMGWVVGLLAVLIAALVFN